MRDASIRSSPFPTEDLVPKKETQSLEFLEKYPDYDGRNVLIGILDTGIDPGAVGIRYMADGKTPKLLDLVDCTGSGDIDISTKKQVSECKDNPDCFQVTGLSGKLLQLRKDWWKSTEDDALPKVQLGVKSAYELFPESLVNRVKSHRKKELDSKVGGHIADVQGKLNEWQQANAAGSNNPSPEKMRQKEDLQALLEFLSDKEWEDDPGMILDCIVFFDGQDQRAVIFTDDDTSETVTPLAEFSKERQFGTISMLDQYNYGINFYDENNVLSIVGDCTPHGTHVAAISAAAEDDRSGVAPGAQLISIKIGDSRMGSMESGSSIARGIMTAVRLGCDVINLSYGEGSQLSNSGRLARMAEELVWRHNIIFVSAVGNNGPALTTLNAPGGITSCILGVAAYVSPDMMKAGYSLSSNSDGEKEDDSNLVGTTYTWSSCGPASDGANGVCVCAPGGAITSVSNWTMQKSMLMNGTSMASPHACGCVALLLSACKAEGIHISPSRIQRAIENTTKQMPNLSSLQQGWGMVQVDRAYEHLKATKEFATEDVHFEVYVDNLSDSPRGVYLRQPEESGAKRKFSIRVNPKFRRVNNVDSDTQRSRIDFEMQFKLSSTASWVSVPEHFMLMNNGRAFKISVDPVKLPHGVHSAKVCGSDAEHPERGVMWHCPITVVKPMPEQQLVELRGLQFGATETKRYFVVPPHGATWMDITIRDGRIVSEDGDTATRLYVLHTVQIIPHAAYREYSKQKYLHLLPQQTSVNSVAVEAGVTCEVDIGRYWSTAGVSKADVTIEFRGVRPVPSELALRSGDSFGMVRVQSDLRDEAIHPSSKFTKWKTPIRPKLEGVISPLGERDIQPWNGKKTYQLVLHYEFSQDEKGSFTPRAPALQDVLYESVYESQIMLVYDGDKKYLGYCDAYPHSIVAPKGTVVIKMQIRHDEPSMLEKLKDMTIWIERKLEKEISLSCYSTREDLLVGGKRTMKKRTLRKGTCASVFFAEPSSSKVPSPCRSGDVLEGNSFYCSGEGSLPGDGRRPDGFPISFTIGPKMDKASSEGELPEPKDERTPEERLSEAIRDLKVDELLKLTSAEKEAGVFDKAYEELYKEYPGHIPLLMANLKNLDGSKKESEVLENIVHAADMVIAEISEDELALHFGKKVDKDDPVQVKCNKGMEKKRSNLIEALVRKALAFVDMKDQDGAEGKVNETLANLKSWVDIDSNGKYAALVIERDTRLGRYGLVLRRLNKLISKSGSKDTGGVKPMTKVNLLDKRSEIMKRLGYDALVMRDKATRLISSPRDYKLF